MPAAAVIPAPKAYIKVVAVKKLVVGSKPVVGGPPKGWHCRTRAIFLVFPWCCLLYTSPSPRDL